MIVAMINIPEMQASFLLVVIQPDNLTRMQDADPITLESLEAGRGALPAPAYPHDFNVLIAYEADEDEVYRRVRGNRIEFMRWLERGRKFILGLDGKEHTFKIPHA